MKSKKLIAALLIISMLSGCASSYYSRGSATAPNGASTSTETSGQTGQGIPSFWEQFGKGTKEFLQMLGMGLVVGIIYKSAPKEAYR